MGLILWSLNEVATLWLVTSFESFLEVLYLISIYAEMCSTNNLPALIKMMACRLFGTEPLSEPMCDWFIDAYVRQMALMSWHGVSHW